jgi:hypothetical protein
VTKSACVHLPQLNHEGRPGAVGRL